MLLSKSLGVNKEGNLTIGGADTVALAKSFGTPLYVFDEGLIVENMRAYKDVLDSYEGGGLACYASKAFSCKEMARLAMREGMGLDVVSGGELYTAKSVDFPLFDICYHGNNKSISELEEAVDLGVGRIIADSAEELKIINGIAARYNKKQKVFLRITPGIEAHTHEFIQTGQEDSKFGVTLSDGSAYKALGEALKYDNIEIIGLHCHIGSQIFETEPFERAAEIMIEFMAKLANELGLRLSELDLGGGFGIKYIESDKPLPYKTYMQKTVDAIKAACEKFDFPKPFLLVEPGRSIVGAAGITLYEVGAIKNIEGIRKYVSIDGGMGDNPRYIMYQADYTALLAHKPYDDADDTVTICGKCCESGDIIIKDAKIPVAKRGDILAVLSTGAYNYSMASNYNRLPRPAAVMVRDGVPRVIIKRETYSDIVRNDI